jgi:hypothetical protein
MKNEPFETPTLLLTRGVVAEATFGWDNTDTRNLVAVKRIL